MKKLRLTPCTQSGCELPATASLVWPGSGRLAYCPVHGVMACKILGTLGLAPRTLDIQSIDMMVEVDAEEPS
jgi:hypothetical protein